MYADKYSCISSRQIEAIVDIPCIQNIEMLFYTILPTSHCLFKFFCMSIRHDFHERSHICEPVS